MPYARFDDLYDDHKKIKRALRRDPAAVAMHAMAITYCNRHISDGEVDADWVDEKLTLMPYKPAQRARVLEVLLDLNLFERKDAETYIVHDFLDWNLSRAQRSALAEQGRKGGRSKPSPVDPGPDSSSPPETERSSPGLDEGFSNGHSEGSSEGLSPPVPVGLSTPTPTPTPSQERTTNSTAGPRSDRGPAKEDLHAVFDAWIESTGKTDRTVFDRKRKGIIERGFKLGFDRDELCDAVRGWKNSPHHRGENDTGAVYNDLGLLLRDAEKIEKFRDLWRRPLSLVRRPAGQPESSAEFLARRGQA